MTLASEHMPLMERLRKGANCVAFLDGAPEPAADVSDMLRKAADEIERLERLTLHFLDAWNMGEEPNAEAITDARKILSKYGAAQLKD